MKMDFMIPTNRELKAAQRWWKQLPEEIKGRKSIWVILAMYAEQVLSRERSPDLEVRPSPKVPPEL